MGGYQDERVRQQEKVTGTMEGRGLKEGKLRGGERKEGMFEEGDDWATTRNTVSEMGKGN